MKRKSIVIVIVILAAGFLMGPDDCGQPPTQGEKALKVLKAVCDLNSRDYVVVRDAIRELKKLLDAPNIIIAINPLERVLSNTPGYYDAHTRGMVANVLIRIGVSLDCPSGDNAIQSVIDELGEGTVETIRASCAYALGASGREYTLDPLIAANENDPSPIVRDTACEALMMLTNGSYSSDVCNYQYENQESALLSLNRSSFEPLTTTALNNSLTGSLTTDELRWIQTHILLPLDTILEENSSSKSE